MSHVCSHSNNKNWGSHDTEIKIGAKQSRWLKIFATWGALCQTTLVAINAYEFSASKRHKAD